MRKPEKIYHEEQKKFNYGKPEGWDKKPPKINPKLFKMKWWMIIRDVWRGREDIEPKYLMRYEGWMHELKVICMTVFVTSCLAYMLFHSSFITESAINEKENNEPTWFDKGFDYIMGRYDNWRGVPPIIAKPDTIYQVVVRDTAVPPPVPAMTQQELDSIIATYNIRLDSVRLVDSTSFIR